MGFSMTDVKYFLIGGEGCDSSHEWLQYKQVKIEGKFFCFWLLFVLVNQKSDMINPYTAQQSDKDCEAKND